MARKRSGKKSCLSSILTGIVALGIIGALFGGGDTKETAETPKDPPKETVEEVIPPEVVEETPEAPDPEPEQPEEPEPETPAQPEPAAEPETPAQPEQAAPKSRTVYVTKSGKCYHYDRHCNGATYYESDLDTALAQGLSPCKKCVG